MSGEDEDATHRQLRNSQDVLFKLVEKHRGHVVNTAGDAVLARFDAGVDAVSCAIEIQSALNQQDRNLSENRQINYRIGINIGDVIEDRKDIFGDGVNVAARLEGLAEPGGICVSESVISAVGKRLPVVYESIGEQTVKNISQPVSAYFLRPQSDSESQTQHVGKPQDISESASKRVSLMVAVFNPFSAYQATISLFNFCSDSLNVF